MGLFGAAWVLGGINDVPTFVGIAVLLFVAGQLVHRLIEDQSGPAQWRWIDAAYIGVMGLSILAFRPYIEHYATAYSSVELWKGPRTPLQPYILIHGIFLFPIAVYAARRTAPHGPALVRRSDQVERRLVGDGRSSSSWLPCVATAALTFVGY